MRLYSSSLFMAEYSIIWINHILFLHSPTDKHLSCLHFLAIMNTATMNICVQLWGGCMFRFFFGYISRTRTAMSSGIPTLSCLRNWQIVSQSSFTTSHSHQQYSNLSTMSPTGVITCLFHYIHPSGGTIVFHYSWNQKSCITWWLMRSSIFSGAYWPFVCLIWRNVYANPLFFNWVLFLFIVKV